jgi:hypothetical protein
VGRIRPAAARRHDAIPDRLARPRKCAAAVRRRRIYASLGHDVDDFAPDIDATGVNECFVKIYAAAHAAEIDDFASASGGVEARRAEA